MARLGAGIGAVLLGGAHRESAPTPGPSASLCALLRSSPDIAVARQAFTSSSSLLSSRADAELDQEVAKALVDLEVSARSHIKAEVMDILISSAQGIEVKNKVALLVQFPFRPWKIV